MTVDVLGELEQAVTMYKRFLAASPNAGNRGEVEKRVAERNARAAKRAVASRETYLIVNQPALHAKPGRPKGRFLQVRGIVDAVMAAPERYSASNPAALACNPA